MLRLCHTERPEYIKFRFPYGFGIQDGFGDPAESDSDSEKPKCVYKRIDLGRKIQICKQCLRERVKEKERKIHRTRLGCPGCNEHVCYICWERYDKHMKPASK